MPKLYFAVAAFLLVGIVSANPTKPSETITELGDQLGSALTNLQTKFFDFVGVANRDELTTKVVNDGKALGHSLEGLVGEFTNTAKTASGQLEAPAQEFANKLKEVAKKLADENPEVVSEGKKASDNIQAELRSVYELTNKFTSSVAAESGPAREELDVVLKKILDATKTAVTDISNTVDSAAKKN